MLSKGRLVAVGRYYLQTKESAKAQRRAMTCRCAGCTEEGDPRGGVSAVRAVVWRGSMGSKVQSFVIAT